MKQHLTYKLLSVLPAVLCGIAFAAVRIAAPSSFAVAIAAAIACTVLAVFAVCERKQFAPELAGGSVAITFASSVTGLLLLACLAFSVYYQNFAPISDRVAVPNVTVSFLSNLFSLLAAVYFLLTALAPSLLANGGRRLLLAITPVLYCAFRILSDFIATSTMPLANGGGYHILSMIMTMLFLLCEAKLIAKKGKTFSYLACGQIAIVLNLTYNIPLLASFGEASALELMHGVFFFVLTLYIAFRLFTLPRANQQADEPTEEPAEEPAAEPAEEQTTEQA